jgi:hypothetical protein
MRSETVGYNVLKLQNDMYSKYKEYIKSHPNLVYPAAFTVAAIDVALDTLKTPLLVIDNLAMAVINLFGAAMYKPNCYTRLALAYTQTALANVFCTPVACAMVPLKFAFQVFDILRKPQAAGTINFQYKATKEPYGLKVSS